MDVEALRKGTRGVAHRTHLNNAGAGLLSDRTLEVMVRQLRLEADIGGYEAADVRRDAVEQTYASLARLVGGQRSEIALFDNSSRAFNAAFYSMRWAEGDRILTGRAEYGSNVLAYLQIAQRYGVEVVVVPNDESGQIDTAALESLIDERTKLIGVAHVPTGGGLVNPAAEVGRIARAAEVPYLLDGTQSVGQFPVDVEAIGADFLTGTGRKFLRGPRGTGFLWVRTAMLDRLDPHVNEIAASVWDGERGFTWKDGATRFETWERSYSNVLGLGAAVDQALELGLSEIAKRTFALGAELRERLDGLRGVKTHDLGRVRCGIVTMKVDGVQSEDVVRRLADVDINVTATEAEANQFDTEDRGVHPLVRLSPHYYNTTAELDRAVAAVEQIAQRAAA
ncbi:aminotransferase class V-fold PLP-dependent enzyme [Kribbella sp. NPDC026611]|uniref:aminotransferase class V-fold PLP-dependent enzyme n=1 Tax=Kribbella sp. NPDC026611 TaxID=3154911 RepID=UPI0033FCFCA7